MPTTSVRLDVATEQQIVAAAQQLNMSQSTFMRLAAKAFAEKQLGTTDGSALVICRLDAATLAGLDRYKDSRGHETRQAAAREIITQKFNPEN